MTDQTFWVSVCVCVCVCKYCFACAADYAALVHTHARHMHVMSEYSFWIHSNWYECPCEKICKVLGMLCFWIQSHCSGRLSGTKRVSEPLQFSAMVMGWEEDMGREDRDAEEETRRGKGRWKGGESGRAERRRWRRAEKEGRTNRIADVPLPLYSTCYSCTLNVSPYICHTVPVVKSHSSLATAGGGNNQIKTLVIWYVWSHHLAPLTVQWSNIPFSLCSEESPFRTMETAKVHLPTHSTTLPCTDVSMLCTTCTHVVC